ncbi:hypothetical protein GQ53DRAFT_891262 [Thozetella sp. PMI_491]|nr:hypothetical protein GQ53DRAFT_891262 [Thozetella sp. PMI_491]
MATSVTPHQSQVEIGISSLSHELAEFLPDVESAVGYLFGTPLQCRVMLGEDVKQAKEKAILHGKQGRPSRFSVLEDARTSFGSVDSDLIGQAPDQGSREVSGRVLEFEMNGHRPDSGSDGRRLARPRRARPRSDALGSSRKPYTVVWTGTVVGLQLARRRMVDQMRQGPHIPAVKVTGRGVLPNAGPGLAARTTSYFDPL